MSRVPVPVTDARSLLFVPGHRPDRFDKALSSGADLVIVDLEDAVAAQDKGSARAAVRAWLAEGHRAVVRINACGTPWFDADLAMAAEHRCAVMVPKAEDPARLAALVARSDGRCALIPLIETAMGVERAVAVCSVPGVLRAAFGNVDLATQCGVEPGDHRALSYARSRLVCASSAAGIAAPIDGVTTAVKDAEVLAADVAHARRMGFTGKLCIHPSQIGITAEGFAPTAADLRWAREVLSAGEQVTTVAGHMVDKPVLDRARRILASVPEPHTAS